MLCAEQVRELISHILIKESAAAVLAQIHQVLGNWAVMLLNMRNCLW